MVEGKSQRDLVAEATANLRRAGEYIAGHAADIVGGQDKHVLKGAFDVTVHLGDARITTVEVRREEIVV